MASVRIWKGRLRMLLNITINRKEPEMKQKLWSKGVRAIAAIGLASLTIVGTGASASATATHNPDSHEHDGHEHNGDGDSHGSPKPDKVEQLTLESKWTVVAEKCSQVPAGTVIKGIGKGVSNQRTVYHEDGSETFIANDVISGTATDQNGKSYTWSYKNSNRASNTSDDLGLFVGKMNDYFELTGGPLAYVTSFKATTAFDPARKIDILSPARIVGDPVQFAPFENRCDPT
jgi:hypothetical protein